MTRRPILWFVGGADIGLKLPLLLAMRKRGYAVGAAGTEPPDRFLAVDVPYRRYQASPAYPLITRRARRGLRRLLREHRPDIVHAFDTLPGMLAPIEARKEGIPGRLCTVTGMGRLYSSGSPLNLFLRPLYRALRRRGSTACGVVVFQNADDRDYYIRNGIVARGRDRLIPGSGIDVDAFAGARPPEEVLAGLRRDLEIDGRVVVTMISRLLPEKGIGHFLEVASRLASRTGIAFLVAGAAPASHERPLRRRAAASGVRWLGHRSDVASILAVSDLFVLPTRYGEGIPRVLLEAAAMGLPLIATDMPGCRDVIRDGVSGLLVPPGDVASLERAILDLVAAGDERTRLGERAREHVRLHFGIDAVAEAHGALYDRMLDPRHVEVAR